MQWLSLAVVFAFDSGTLEGSSASQIVYSYILHMTNLVWIIKVIEPYYLELCMIQIVKIYLQNHSLIMFVATSAFSGESSHGIHKYCSVPAHSALISNGSPLEVAAARDEEARSISYMLLSSIRWDYWLKSMAQLDTESDQLSVKLRCPMSGTVSLHERFCSCSSCSFISWPHP